MTFGRSLNRSPFPYLMANLTWMVEPRTFPAFAAPGDPRSVPWCCLDNNWPGVSLCGGWPRSAEYNELHLYWSTYWSNWDPGDTGTAPVRARHGGIPPGPAHCRSNRLLP